MAGSNADTFTKIPNYILDWLMPELSPAELKVLLYVLRRTLGFHKASDKISLDQFCEGVRKKNGDILDLGTGLSREGVIQATQRLEERGFLLVKRRGPGRKHVSEYSVGLSEIRAYINSQAKVNALDQFKRRRKGQLRTRPKVNSVDHSSRKKVNGVDPQKKYFKESNTKAGTEGIERSKEQSEKQANTVLGFAAKDIFDTSDKEENQTRENNPNLKPYIPRVRRSDPSLSSDSEGETKPPPSRRRAARRPPIAPASPNAQEELSPERVTYEWARRNCLAKVGEIPPLLGECLRDPVFRENWRDGPEKRGILWKAAMIFRNDGRRLMSLEWLCTQGADTGLWGWEKIHNMNFDDFEIPSHVLEMIFRGEG
jgi:hypothetical protein